MQPELVEIKTSDGLFLPGLLYEVKKSKRAAIYLHGNGSASVFYNEPRNGRLYAEALAKQGISFLAFNNRGAHIIKNLTAKKNSVSKRLPYGTAYEKIKDCVLDIEGALRFLRRRGFRKFYLMGESTGANKICVYDHYRPRNPIGKYVLLSGGDDVGIYYRVFGKKKFWELLRKSKRKILRKKGGEVVADILPYRHIFSYQGFYDIASPDGDYNMFPFWEAFGKVRLSRKPLFRYFRKLHKPTLVIYGEKDEFSWNPKRALQTLEKFRPDFRYVLIKNADHGFHTKKKEVANNVAAWIDKI